MVITRGKGGWREGEEGKGRTNGDETDLTWACEHRVQCTHDILWNCETYIILLTNVTPTNSTKRNLFLLSMT